MSTTTTSGTTSSTETVNGYQIPKWAGKPPSGLHLDIMKEGKMIQKLMIDEKKYYFFGRNKDVCDFVTDHASCSRVHAVLIWHKHLNRSFLVDLGSAHGTYIGSIRLEGHKPQQVFIDSEIRFGASTRTYIIRERPQINKQFPSMLASQSSATNGDDSGADGSFSHDKDDLNNSSLSMLPESEAELDNLTEFNTAHNKRIAQLVDITTTNPNPMLVKRKKKTVTFCDEEEIINPEDIDPTIGRFRNMIQTSVIIPNRKKRPMPPPFGQYSSQFQPTADLMLKRARQETNAKFTVTSHVSHDDDDEETETLYDEEYESTTIAGTNSLFITNLGINMPNIAPDVNEDYSSSHTTIHSSSISKEHDLFKQQHLELINRQFQQQYQYYDHDDHDQNEDSGDLNKKKKYAKEAWPGRKSAVLPHATNEQQPTANNSKQQEQPKRSLSPQQKSIQSVSPPPTQSQSSSSSSTNVKRLII